MGVKAEIVAALIGEGLNMNWIAPSEKKYSQKFMIFVFPVILADPVGKSIEKFDISEVLSKSQLWKRSRAEPILFSRTEKFEVLDFSLLFWHHKDLSSAFDVVDLPLCNRSIEKR